MEETKGHHLERAGARPFNKHGKQEAHNTQWLLVEAMLIWRQTLAMGAMHAYSTPHDHMYYFECGAITAIQSLHHVNTALQWGNISHNLPTHNMYMTAVLLQSSLYLWYKA